MLTNAEALSKRGIREAWCVYCSHYEMDFWGSREGAHPEQMHEVFDKCLPGKITPFIKAPCCYGFQKYLDAGKRDDILWRRDSSYDGTAIFLKDGRFAQNYLAAMKIIYDRGEHIEGHFHHDQANRTTRCKDNLSHDQKVFHEYISEHDCYDADVERLENAIQMFWEIYEHVTGAKMHPWHFTHGCWSLQASDLDICRLTNEMQILIRNGAVGSWDWPAGRNWTDPGLKEPFTCLPIDEARGYDVAAADPRPIRTHGFRPHHWFAWSHNQQPGRYNSSCDFYQNGGPEKVESLNTTDRIANWVLRDLAVIDGVLLIKLHGHCLNKAYLADLDNPDPPLARAVNGWLGQLADDCEGLGLPFRWLTVREMVSKLKELCPVG